MKYFNKRIILAWWGLCIIAFTTFVLLHWGNGTITIPKLIVVSLWVFNSMWVLMHAEDYFYPLMVKEDEDEIL